MNGDDIHFFIVGTIPSQIHEMDTDLWMGPRIPFPGRVGLAV